MNLQTARTYTDNYLLENNFFKVEANTWSNTFIEIEIMQDVIQEDVFLIHIKNIEIKEYVIALFPIPESETDYHTILSLLKIQ